MNANSIICAGDKVRIVGHYPCLVGQVLSVEADGLLDVWVPGWGGILYSADAVKKVSR